MKSDLFILRRYRSGFPAIEVVDRVSHIIPRLAESYPRQQLDMLMISASPRVGSIGFHTHGVDAAPPKELPALRAYSDTAVTDNAEFFCMDHLGMVHSLTHYNPREEIFFGYKIPGAVPKIGSVQTTGIPCIGGTNFVWEYHRPWWNSTFYTLRGKPISKGIFGRAIANSDNLLVVIIDLDALQFRSLELTQSAYEGRSEQMMQMLTSGIRKQQALWRGKVEYLHYPSSFRFVDLPPSAYVAEDEVCTDSDLMQRLARIQGAIIELPTRPSRIVVTRSQRPVPRVPPHIVDRLETLIEGALCSVFR